MTDKKFTWRAGESLSSEKPDTEKKTKRKDWGYTDQYRRMMQRDSRRTTSSTVEKNL